MYDLILFFENCKPTFAHRVGGYLWSKFFMSYYSRSSDLQWRS